MLTLIFVHVSSEVPDFFNGKFFYGKLFKFNDDKKFVKVKKDIFKTNTLLGSKKLFTTTLQLNLLCFFKFIFKTKT